MATLRKRGPKWQVQVRREGHSFSKTFHLKEDALKWVREQAQSGAQGGVLWPPRPEADHLPISPDGFACPPLAHLVGGDKMSDGFPFGGGCQIILRSFSATLSSMASAQQALQLRILILEVSAV